MESLRKLLRYSILDALTFFVMVCMFKATVLIFEIGLVAFMKIDLSDYGIYILLGGIFLFVSIFVIVFKVLIFAFPEILDFLNSDEDF